MASSRRAIQGRLIAAFRTEAGERITDMADCLAQLDQSHDEALLEQLFRDIHSLKGAARAVSLSSIESLCQAWEGLLAAIRKGRLELNDDHIVLGRKAYQCLSQMLNDLDQPEPQSLPALCRSLRLAGDGRKEAAPPVADDAAAVPGDRSAVSAASHHPARIGGDSQLKVKADRFDQLIYIAESLHQSKLEAGQYLQMVEEAQGRFSEWHRMSQEIASARQRLDRGNESGDVQAVSTLVACTQRMETFLARWENHLNKLARQSRRMEHNVAAISDQVRQELQEILMLQCSEIVHGVPAMVHEIANATGKAVNLAISGESLHVDKRVLDSLKSPLHHLLRNAVDHGIETPEARRRAGKQDKGNISISFVHGNGGRFSLVVEDDGRGLDPGEIKTKALALGVIDREISEEMSNAEVAKLAFRSGLSTSSIITDLSGRGLGLAIVRDHIEALGGQVDVDSQPGQGCRFTFHLPTTLATYRALLVQVSGRSLAIPATHVERVLRLAPEALKSVEGRLNVRVGDAVLPAWRLRDVLSLPAPDTTRQSWVRVAVLQWGDVRFGLLVDEVEGDQEIVIKALGPLLARVPNVMAATQLGDGRIVPILHPQDLYQTACGTTSAPVAEQEQAGLREPPSILVAEDSVTSRGLIKTILESVGYRVETASDGREAWERLQEEPYTVLVSDIEMPRMDGFELTARIREHPDLAELPVVLVTALKSREDQEKGRQVGANAYIVKSSFDQGNLLEIVRQFV
ncbi:response regulator [Marinobacter halodurans]|uniref:histidine kinase n=1 Tax=Marinobacter halodurans TaxID=2528979 RepID=A0ABY1ZMM9_9GAMM|nr:response regulator [Marinobacter halodurans]TBW57652.1 response regulator [Marinobacter halodurans]